MKTKELEYTQNTEKIQEQINELIHAQKQQERDITLTREFLNNNSKTIIDACRKVGIDIYDKGSATTETKNGVIKIECSGRFVGRLKPIKSFSYSSAEERKIRTKGTKIVDTILSELESIEGFKCYVNLNQFSLVRIPSKDTPVEDMCILLKLTFKQEGAQF